MQISEELRLDHQHATRRRDRSDCPPAAELAELATGGSELTAERRGALLDHLTTCADCAVEARLVLESRDVFGLGPTASQPAASQPAASQPAASQPAASQPATPPQMATSQPAASRPAADETLRRRTPPAWLAAAAALVLALGLAWQSGLWRGDADPAPSPLRSTPALEVQPANGAALDTAPALFVWPAQAGATAYRLELLDAGARRLWRGPWRPAARLELPAEAGPELGAGDYLWVVEVRGPVARRELGPYSFKIR